MFDITIRTSRLRFEVVLTLWRGALQNNADYLLTYLLTYLLRIGLPTTCCNQTWPWVQFS